MPSQKFINLFLFFTLIAYSACGSSSARRDVPPNQDSVNAVIQGIVVNVEDLAAQLATISNCQEFQNLVASLPAVVPCAQGGSAQVVVLSSHCEDGPPMEAQVSFDRTSLQCTFDGKSTTGTLTTQMLINDTQITGIVAAKGIVIIGIRFDFNDLTIPINAEGIGQNCSGTASAFDYPCTITSDCSQCPLETQP